MANHNIIIRNETGKRKYANQRISAKRTQKAQKVRVITPKKEVNNTPRELNRIITSGTQFAQGNSSGIMNIIKFKSLATVGLALQAVEKVGNLMINIEEAQTGNSIGASNAKTLIQTISSGGLNLASGLLQSEIFTKRIIARQNYSKDYSRELYNLNNNGDKYKIR